MNSNVKRNDIHPKLFFLSDNNFFEYKELREITKVINTRIKTNKYDFILSVSNSLGFIQQSKYFKNRQIASIDTSNYKVIGKNDFAFNPSRINVGSIAVYNGEKKCIVSPLYQCFKANEEIVLPNYLNYFFKSKQFKNMLRNKLEGSVRKGLNSDNFAKIKILIPNTSQQIKISNFLNFLSEDLKIQEKLLENLTNTFDFFLNNILKIFSVKKVKIFEIQELTVETKNKNKNNEVSLIFTLSQNLGIIPQSEKFGNRNVASKDLSKYKIINKNELVFNPWNINVGSIEILLNNEKGVVSPAYHTFKVTNEFLLPKFLNYHFKSKNFIDQVNKKMNVSVRSVMNYTEFKHLKISVPPISDQLKIIKFLDAFDNIINAHKKILKLLLKRRKFLIDGLYSE